MFQYRTNPHLWCRKCCLSAETRFFLTIKCFLLLASKSSHISNCFFHFPEFLKEKGPGHKTSLTPDIYSTQLLSPTAGGSLGEYSDTKVLKRVPCPSWFGSVNRASACRLRGPRFDSSQGHMPGLRAQSPVGGMQEAADQ
uniref:Uncharacterized protein n=1 Tax=Myotis myotis TaxID=51298 RepID=A0A7J7RFL9_MYOMY|nr:hypothetical protein mMyoMyo1_010350 [Myotis myotis]